MKKKAQKKWKVGISGAAGRMGQELIQILYGHPEMELVCVLDRNPLPQIPGVHQLKEFDSQMACNVDVWIDFSTPKLLGQILKPLAENRIPVVSGTTGLKLSHQARIKRASEKTPILWAPNMSLGMALVRRMLSVLQTQLPVEVQIVDLHHKWKKDRPSGTALELVKTVSWGKNTRVLPTLSVRAGTLFGNHQVYAFLEDETIRLEHVAQSRALFARGAIHAAQWLVKQRPGLYKLDHLLEEDL